MHHIGTAIRVSGAAFNLFLFVLFAWACLRLWGLSSDSLAAAGGMEYLRGLASALASPSSLPAFALDAGAPGRAWNLAVAWAAAIAAAGCGWMALLGGRWLAGYVSRAAAGR